MTYSIPCCPWRPWCPFCPLSFLLMSQLLKRLFHFYPGEERNALAFALLGFLWSLGITAGLKFADALFLLHVGASSLPTVYIITACLMVALAALLLKCVHAFHIDQLFIAVLTVAIGFYAFAFICFKLGWGGGEEAQWLWYLLRIGGYIFFSISLTCYWSFVDQYYPLQDAKRLYNLFTSGVFLGIATTGVVLRVGLLDFPQLAVMIMLVLLSACFWTRHIAKTRQPVYDENALEIYGEQEENTFRHLFRSILSSRFTLFLMTSSLLVYVLIVITEYSYLSAFDAHFDPGISLERGGEQHAQLTLFLGQWLTVVSVANLLAGLFLYNRLVRRFGANNLVLLTPMALFLNFWGWSFSSSLLFPIIGFMIVEGMVYVIEDNNFTLLLNAVPSRMKFKIRLIIESFMEPIGMLISSLLISLVPMGSTYLGWMLAAYAVIVALLIRRWYLKAIYTNLTENAIHFYQTTQEWYLKQSSKKRKATERRLLALMRISDEPSQLLALEGLLSINHAELNEKILIEVSEFSTNGKIQFINLLLQSNKTPWAETVKLITLWSVNGTDQQLRGHALFYLAVNGQLPLETAYEHLHNSDIKIQAAAILAIRLHKSNAAETVLAELLSSKDADKVSIGIEIIGRSGDITEIDRLIPFLKDPSLKIARHAADAVVRLIDANGALVTPLLTLLGSTNDTELRQAYIKALSKVRNPQAVPLLAKALIQTSVHFRPHERRLTEMAIITLGLETLPPLLDILKDTRAHERARILAGKVIGKLDLAVLKQELFDVLDLEIDRAFFYYYHYHAIPPQYPHLDLTLLQDDLLSSFHAVLDFIIQLLGVAGEIEDCDLLSRSLRSRNPKVRSQVLETLEKTCELKIYRELHPLIADLSPEEKMAIYIKRGYQPLSLQDLLDKMDQSTIYGDQIVAIALKYRLDLPNWRESLKAKVAKKEEILHHFAYELLET